MTTKQIQTINEMLENAEGYDGCGEFWMYNEVAPAIRELLKENGELWAMLERLEWSGMNEGDRRCCPFCAASWDTFKHSSECKLAAHIISKK